MQLALAILVIAALGAFVWLAAIVAVGVVGPKSPRRQTGPNEAIVAVDGTRLRCRMSGAEGPTLVFLHGFAQTLDQWDGVIEALGPRRCLAVDLPGFGGSDRPSLPYELDNHRDYVIGLMDELEIDSAVLVGFSMGGSIAAWTAATAPDRVAASVLIAPSALPGSLTPSFPAGPLYRPGPANRFVRALVGNGLYRRLFPSGLAPQVLGVTSCYDDRFADALGDIAAPVLLIWSPGDDTVRFEANETYGRLVPDLTFEPARAPAGHAILYAEPEATASSIDRFVRALTPPEEPRRPV